MVIKEGNMVIKKESKVCLIPLGGLGEIGKNMTAIKYGNSILMIDCGMMFPEDDMPGIDVVLPDFSYILGNRKKVKGIVLTHGHEDHIGALPYLLREVNVPVYGTKLTLGILANKLKEHRVKAELIEVKPGDIINLAPFKVEFIRVNHSIADAVAMAIQTPAGLILHTGDFKLDLTPVDGQMTAFHRFAALGEKGVLLMLSDSTNVEREGYTPSESTVGNLFDDTIRNAPGRVIVASFSTNIHRLQQVISFAAKYNRKVAIVGRSMVNVVGIASELGYLKLPRNIVVDIDKINALPPSKVVILTTGSQGEPMSSLTRIANSEHRQIKTMEKDTIIVSATPIPGNEKSVAKTIDSLFSKGVNVIYESAAGIHVSGHASQEELKMILAMVRPKYFVPVHGEVRMLYKHAMLAQSMGVKADNIFVMENGQVLEVSQSNAVIKGKVASGKVMIDGQGSVDVGNIVLQDRRQLAKDGIMVVIITVDSKGMVMVNPEIISRGFIYLKESEQLLGTARNMVAKLMTKYEGHPIRDFATVKSDVRENLGKLLYDEVKRKPMIITVIVNID